MKAAIKKTVFASKTVKEWYKQLGWRVRGAANRNLESLRANDVVPTLQDALLAGFNWNTSPEGTIYWAQVYQNVDKRSTK